MEDHRGSQKVMEMESLILTFRFRFRARAIAGVTGNFKHSTHMLTTCNANAGSDQRDQKKLRNIYNFVVGHYLKGGVLTCRGGEVWWSSGGGRQ